MAAGPPSAMPLCDKYRDLENAYGYCVYRYVGGLRTVAEMESACALAGDWSSACHHAWVSGRMQPNTGFSTEELLAACGGNPDCAFELIDFRPEADPVEQMKLCAAHAGPYARDCAGHAMQRWWLTDPSAEEWAYLAQYTTPFADRVGYWLGVEVGCFSKGTCAGVGFVQQQCEQSLAQFQAKPATCPKREKAPLNMPLNSSATQELWLPGQGGGQGQGQGGGTPPPNQSQGTPGQPQGMPGQPQGMPGQPQGMPGGGGRPPGQGQGQGHGGHGHGGHGGQGETHRPGGG